jgi:hypothetical protein
MPFYFAKSVKAGPFRFNLSKSGVGMSVGIKGLRFGIGPQGHYVRAGLNGFYYRKTFSPSSDSPSEKLPAGTARPRAPKVYAEQSVQMAEVSSGDVLNMQDERFQDVLAEMNAKQAALPMGVTLAVAGGAIGLLMALGLGAQWLMAALALGTAGLLIGIRLDESRRSAVILYDLETPVAAKYEAMTRAFDALASCAGKWHVDAGGAVHDIHAWKRNAGASHIVDKRPTTMGYGLPRVLKSNVTPPMMAVGKETLYFLPDILLVVESGKVGAVAYDMLSIQSQDSPFIEDGPVPRDTPIIGHQWKHPNKSGGPDRRFANNYQIPVCLYESIHLTSRNGLNELIQVSRNGVARPFSESIAAIASVSGTKAGQSALPQL